MEYAAGPWKSPFPREWGPAPGDADSEERASWVRRNVRQHMAGTPLSAARAAQLLLNHLEEEYRNAEG
jgi:hypothetical protein